MTYRVELAEGAVVALSCFCWTRTRRDLPAAARSFSRLEPAVYALEKHPFRWVAPESRKRKRKRFHLLYRKKPHVYRVIYEIDEPRRTVWVLTSPGSKATG